MRTRRKKSTEVDTVSFHNGAFEGGISSDKEFILIFNIISTVGWPFYKLINRNRREPHNEQNANDSTVYII